MKGRKNRMRSFEELLNDLESKDLDLNGVEISDYEIGMRLQCFFNGFEQAEKVHKKAISNFEKELKEYHDRQALNTGIKWEEGQPWWKGRKHTQDTKDKIIKSLKAKGWKGIPLFEETKQLLKGHIVSKETRDLISKKNKGKKRTKKQSENIGLGHKGMRYKKHMKAELN